jgi:hypothetical protein
MSLMNLVNIIKNDPYDVTYIGIGSALLRPAEAKDRQQFPPFIEKLIFTSNYTIRLINIDSKFENPLFLKSYIKNQQIISDIESKTDRLSIVYLEETLLYDKIFNKDVDIQDLSILDEINKVIIQQNNLLIVGNYTGIEVSKFERYFSNLYKNTDYEIGFNKYITYDFTNDGNGYCSCNLIKNFPIIDNKEIIQKCLDFFNTEYGLINYCIANLETLELVKKEIDVKPYRQLVKEQLGRTNIPKKFVKGTYKNIPHLRKIVNEESTSFLKELMKNNYIYVFLFVIVVAVYLLYIFVYDGTSRFTSDIYGKSYSVRGSNNNIKQIKANLLGNVYNRLETLINTLKNDQSLKSNVAVNRLINNWNKGVTIKETGIMENDAAYVLNKKYMSICLINFCDLSKCNNINSIENLNLLAYVGIHELAHIMSEEIGHATEFRNNFKFLLDYAKNIDYYDLILKENIKLYIDLNKLKTPDNFCGVSVVNSIS